MKINIEIERRVVVELPPARLRGLVDDVETTIGRFPKLKKLTCLGPDQYLTELKTIGSSLANIQHDVTYGAHYQRSADGSTLSWRPLPDRGNASIAGSVSVLAHADGSEIRFKVIGELRDIPVPMLYRLAAGPFIQGKFTHLIEIFLERTREALVANPPPTQKKKAAPAAKKTAR